MERLQRSISGKYEENKKGESYCKTGNDKLSVTVFYSEKTICLRQDWFLFSNGMEVYLYCIGNGDVL